MAENRRRGAAKAALTRKNKMMMMRHTVVHVNQNTAHPTLIFGYVVTCVISGTVLLVKNLLLSQILRHTCVGSVLSDY